MEGILSRIKHHRSILAIYGANLILSLHYFLIIYINSSYMEGFVSEKIVGTLFVLGAIFSLFLFYSAPNIVRKIGLYKYFLLTILLEFVGILGLIFAKGPKIAIVAFILHQAAIPMILYCLDIFLEHVSKDESNTGSVRGVYLTLANTTLVLSPMVVGIMLLTMTFNYIYAVSALLLLPLLFVSTHWLKSIKPEPPKRTGIKETISETWENKDIRFGMLSHYVLQFFYATMVVYLPLHLVNTIGFSWPEIGALFTIMLLPFVIFEIPVGWLADKKYGEKELMIFGFIVSSVSALLIAIQQNPIFLIWAFILFLSRVGASFAEITTESYFFKHTKGSDSDTISLFRMSRPLSYVVAPIIATILLALSGMQSVFIALSAITILGAFFALRIKDTR